MILIRYIPDVVKDRITIAFDICVHLTMDVVVNGSKFGEYIAQLNNVIYANDSRYSRVGRGRQSLQG
jgi:hypothetical protein